MVFQSTSFSSALGYLVEARVSAAAMRPMVGTVRPVTLWVMMSRMTPEKMRTLSRNRARLGMTSPGFRSSSSGAAAPIPGPSLVRKTRAK